MANITEISDSVEIKIEDQSYNVDVITGTFDERAIDIGSLRKDTSYITLDPGFKNTGSTQSAITFIDGENGILLHRGYGIEELADKASFPEVIYLLLNEDLPSQAQLDKINQSLSQYALVPDKLKAVLDAMPDETHPMGMLSALMFTLTGFYPDMLDSWENEETRWKSMYSALGHMPALVAYIYRRKKKLPYIDADPSLGYVANFIYMMTGEVDTDLVEALETLLILHADHEQNCSASTVRMAGSSHVNLFAAIGAGVAALWGPLHGGANQAVLEMLENIKENGGDTSKYIEKAKDKSDPFRLMGFGHRVYKNYDPRAKVIKKYVDVVLNKLEVEDPISSIAKGLEEAALQDDYFVQRKLFPNVDFYSGIIYRAMGIPVEMFTVMFAFGRLPGWIAQWKEMREAKEPIGRPRQVYVGADKRSFVPIEQRA